MTKCERMAEARKNGMSNAQIADRFNVKIESVSSMCSRAKNPAAMKAFRRRQQSYRKPLPAHLNDFVYRGAD